MLEPEWNMPGSYSEGLISFCGTDASSDNAYDDISPFSEGLACVEQNDLSGCINEAGNPVIPRKYDSASTFQKDRAWVKQGGAYRLIDSRDNTVCTSTVF